MASPMIPPERAGDFLACLRLGRGADRAARRRRLASAAISGSIGDGRQAVLMDAPPPHEDPRPFIAVAEWLASVGLSAPDILARDLERGPAAARRFRRRPAARGARHVDPSASASSTSWRPTSSSIFTVIRRWTACPPTGSSSGSTELMLFTDWYCPAVGLDVDERRLSRRPGRKCWSRSPRTASARSRCCAIIMPRTSCWSTAARASPISACSTSRTRSPATRPTISPRCSRTPAATCRPSSSGRCSTATSPRPAMARRSSAPTGRSPPSATRASSASSPGFGSATASPRYRRFQPRMWGLLERDLSQPLLEPVRAWFDANIPAARPPRSLAGGGMMAARRSLRLRPEDRGGGSRHGDGHGRRARQAHAPADRDRSQAVDRGRRQGADRPCPRPPARCRRQQGRGQRPLSSRCAGSASHGQRRRPRHPHFGRARAAARDRRRPGPCRADDRQRSLLRDQQRQSTGSTGRADTLRLLASHWDEGAMDALLLLVPQARAFNHRGLGDFHMDRFGRLQRRGRSQGRALSSSPASRSSPSAC